MLSPTRQGIRRSDKWGEGRYGAGRDKKLHDGADYICDPGQPVYSPIEGIVVRESRPYPESDFSGVVIQGKHIVIQMFYFKPLPNIIGLFVEQGQIIGAAQDISTRYPGMTPHVHLEIKSLDPAILTEMI